ncbi:MAG TPA: molybdopterin-dependent oxidoreductase [Acidobacteriota bacterium]|nr:molybdopterin-dependent oxidoreductase [Acidobacteriota bacterium]
MSIRKEPTTCVMDCPDTCALEVEVEDGRVKRIGAGADPSTGGFICSKVARFDRRLEHRDRVLRPLRRSGPKGSGQFQAISWQEAVDEIAGRWQDIIGRWGGEAILPYHYGGSNGFLSDGGIDRVLFARLGASRLLRTLCAAPAGAVQKGLYGNMPGVAYEDFPKARFILLWGVNPKVSHIHLIPFLKKAKKRGAFIAAVDPQRHFSDREIDLHLPVLPGADLPLALSMIRCWDLWGCLDDTFVEGQVVDAQVVRQAAKSWTLSKASQASGVAEEDIEKLAREYAQRDPALVRCGWGVERNRNGGQAIAAILSMPALLGKFGQRGGGYTLSNGAGVQLDWEGVFGSIPWETRELNMTPLGRHLTDPKLEPPIQSLFVYNCNPMATVPDQRAVERGLNRDDLFTVVHEQVMTDSCRWADLVLPATTFLEHHDLRRGYGLYRVGAARPVVEARGEALPNQEVFLRLGRAMGLKDACFQWDSQRLQERTARHLFSPAAGPVEVEDVLSGRGHRLSFSGNGDRLGPVQMMDVRPGTEDGKIHLAPPQLGTRPYHWIRPQDEDYPLALISPATNKMITSTLGEFNYPELRLTLHPQDAASRGLAEDDRVRIFNERGEVECRLSLSGKVRRGVAVLPKGAWKKASLNGFTAVALCPDHVSEVGGGACFNDARVEVEKSPCA